MKYVYVFILMSLVFPQCGFFNQHKAMSLEEFCTMLDKKITNASDLERYFPKSPQEAYDVATCAIERVRKDFDALIKIAAEQRTFTNTARALDIIGARMGNSRDALFVLEMVSPDAAMREACHEGVLRMQTFAVD